MLTAIFELFDKRRRMRQLIKRHARRLLTVNPDTAYYDAHRLATKARCSGDSQAFLHWERVAADIARVSDNPMDSKVVQSMVEDEEHRAASELPHLTRSH